MKQLVGKDYDTVVDKSVQKKSNSKVRHTNWYQQVTTK